MKKVFSMFLCLIFVFALVPSNNVSASTAPEITVNKSIAKQGETVSATISINNNPGIIAMAFCITYDSEVLEYSGYENGYLSNYNIKDHKDKGWISFVSIEDSDRKENGNMLTLLFKVKDNAITGTYDIGIANNNPEKYGESLHNSFADSNEKYIIPTVNKGSVQIIDIDPVKGDVNGDGTIGGRDYALLIQFINEMNVAIVESAADVNNDGKINGRDYAILLQYLNGWDVKLG